MKCYGLTALLPYRLTFLPAYRLASYRLTVRFRTCSDNESGACEGQPLEVKNCNLPQCVGKYLTQSVE